MNLTDITWRKFVHPSGSSWITQAGLLAVGVLKIFQAKKGCGAQYYDLLLQFSGTT